MSTLESIKANATIEIKEGSLLVKGNIGPGAVVTVHNGDVTIEKNIAPNAIVTAHKGNVTVKGSIASGAIVTAHKGGVAVGGSIGSCAQVSSAGALSVIENIYSDAVVTLTGDCSLTVGGIINSEKINLNGGMLHTPNNRPAQPPINTVSHFSSGPTFLAARTALPPKNEETSLLQNEKRDPERCCPITCAVM